MITYFATNLQYIQYIHGRGILYRTSFSLDKIPITRVDMHEPFYQHGLNLIPIWVSNHTHSEVWNGIIYPFINFNSYTVEVLKWIRNFVEITNDIDISQKKPPYHKYKADQTPLYRPGTIKFPKYKLYCWQVMHVEIDDKLCEYHSLALVYKTKLCRSYKQNILNAS